MLIKIDPVLSPDLLFHLRSMGHGEKLILADANFPANTTNDKVYFQVLSLQSGGTVFGNTNENNTSVSFIRLGDT